MLAQYAKPQEDQYERDFIDAEACAGGGTRPIDAGEI